jgi:hypothetical protein
MRGAPGPASYDNAVMGIGVPELSVIYEACSRVKDTERRRVSPIIVTRTEVEKGSRHLGYLSPIQPSRLLV